MKLLIKTIIVITLTFLLASCNLPARPTSSPGIDQAQAGTIVAMTLKALTTKAPSATLAVEKPNVPASTATASTLSTPTFVLTATTTSTITPTYAAPLLTFEGNTNCRQGPGTNYKVEIVLLKGQKIESIGVSGNYWVVKIPNTEKTCWVAADFATPFGSTWTLPTVETPLPPTRIPPPAPTWSKWEYNCAFAAGGNTITMSLRWTDHATGETGYKVYRGEEVIATLAPDSDNYTDVTFLESGKSFDYYVEVFSEAGIATTSKINASCQ